MVSLGEEHHLVHGMRLQHQPALSAEHIASCVVVHEPRGLLAFLAHEAGHGAGDALPRYLRQPLSDCPLLSNNLNVVSMECLSVERWILSMRCVER